MSIIYHSYSNHHPVYTVVSKAHIQAAVHIGFIASTQCSCCMLSRTPDTTYSPMHPRVINRLSAPLDRSRAPHHITALQTEPNTNQNTQATSQQHTHQSPYFHHSHDTPTNHIKPSPTLSHTTSTQAPQPQPPSPDYTSPHFLPDTLHVTLLHQNNPCISAPQYPSFFPSPLTHNSTTLPTKVITLHTTPPGPPETSNPIPIQPLFFSFFLCMCLILPQCECTPVQAWLSHVGSRDLAISPVAVAFQQPPWKVALLGCQRSRRSHRPPPQRPLEANPPRPTLSNRLGNLETVFWDVVFVSSTWLECVLDNYWLRVVGVCLYVWFRPGILMGGLFLCNKGIVRGCKAGWRVG